MFTKILAAVDGSPGSRDAAAMAAALGAVTSASVELVGVFHDPWLRLPSRTDPADAPGEMASIVAAVRDELAPQAEVRVVSDHAPARGLQEAAERDGASLLVLGSSSGGDEGCVRAGRVARQALRSAPCPVLVVARGGARIGGRIVVGLDGSAESQLALRAARELAQATGAELHVVAVVDDRFPVSHVPGAVIVDLATWESVVAADRERMRAMLSRLIPDEDGVRTEVCEGDPTDALIAAATGADLLVVGSRRWGLLSRVVLGSTAEDVMASAPCSVLVVPRPDAEPEGASSR